MSAPIALFRLECRHCKKPIGGKQISTAVYVKYRSPNEPYYNGAAGPFHAKCGKLFNEQLKANR